MIVAIYQTFEMSVFVKPPHQKFALYGKYLVFFLSNYFKHKTWI